MTCRCRNCGATYDENKSRADWKGYCSQACVKAKAKKCGWVSRPLGSGSRTFYDALSAAGEIGSVRAEVPNAR